MKRLFVAALLTANLATACRIYDLYQDWDVAPAFGWFFGGGDFQKGPSGILVLPDPNDEAFVGWSYHGSTGALISISGFVEYAEPTKWRSNDFDLYLNGPPPLTSGTVSHLNPGPTTFRFGVGYAQEAFVLFVLRPTPGFPGAIANVNLVYETVPEPGTFGLMATAGLALLVAGYRHHHQT